VAKYRLYAHIVSKPDGSVEFDISPTSTAQHADGDEIDYAAEIEANLNAMKR
jgi:hypothetical protein